MVKRIAAAVGAALGGLALMTLALCGVVRVANPEVQFPPALPLPQGSSYRVAVLGDSQKGLSNLRNLVGAAKREGAKAIFHTGDLVSDNDEGHYALAGLYLRRAGLDVPFRVVPGNHDVKRGTERFERYVGPLESQFVWGRVAFLLVNNATGAPPDVAQLRRRLDAFPAADAAVLLMHVPPFTEAGSPLPEYREFLDWLEGTPRVKYLLCGHLHYYLRHRVGTATVIINGVGGDYESWKLTQKVYATILDVNGAEITDRPVALPPEHGFVENVEHLALGHVAEAYRARPVACWAGTLVLAAVTGFLSGVARLRKKA